MGGRVCREWGQAITHVLLARYRERVRDLERDREERREREKREREKGGLCVGREEIERLQCLVRNQTVRVENMVTTVKRRERLQRLGVFTVTCSLIPFLLGALVALLYNQSKLWSRKSCL